MKPSLLCLPHITDPLVASFLYLHQGVFFFSIFYAIIYNI